MSIRLLLAVFVGKLLRRAVRTTGKGGTALPGLVGQRVAPDAITVLCRQLARGSIVVTGTNGKTTTSRMLSSILQEAGLSPVHNRSGSNLIRGIASTLIEATSIRGRLEADIGLFEVDEAALPQALKEIRPRVVVINNLFRDQLDRYGEVATVAQKWAKALQQLPSSTTVVLNADDPTVAHLGQSLQARVQYFGLEDEAYVLARLPHAADSTSCPNCGAALVYTTVFASHLGKYACPQCLARRPTLDVAGSEIALNGAIGSTVALRTPNGPVQINLGVPGLYNVYNAAAASAAGLALGLDSKAIGRGLEGFRAAFGRIERVKIGDKDLMLILVKNPVGFNEVLRTLLVDEGQVKLAIVINDLIADGRDVSWLWDVDFELLSGRVEWAVTSGIRAHDMALRLKYAGVDQANLTNIPDLQGAIGEVIERLNPDETAYVLPTYTSMLETRSLLNKMGYVENFWEQ